jgi:hypothetical protein
MAEALHKSINGNARKSAASQKSIPQYGTQGIQDSQGPHLLLSPPPRLL